MHTYSRTLHGTVGSNPPSEAAMCFHCALDECMLLSFIYIHTMQHAHLKWEFEHEDAYTCTDQFYMFMYTYMYITKERDR